LALLHVVTSLVVEKLVHFFFNVVHVSTDNEGMERLTHVNLFNESGERAGNYLLGGSGNSGEPKALSIRVVSFIEFSFSLLLFNCNRF
jgi:hypothetical protein